MINDVNTILTTNQSLVGLSGDQPSQRIFDVAGVGVGQAPPNNFGITNAVFGQDIGIGDGQSPPNLLVVVGVAFVTADAATLKVKLQASVDTGAPGYTPAAWDTIVESDALPAAVLTAGAKIAEFTIPPRYPGQAFPRFYQLIFEIPAGLTFTAGTIANANIITGRDDYPMYPANY